MSKYWRLRGFDSTHSEAPFCGPRPKEKIEQSQIEEKSEKAKEVSENLTDKTGKLKQCNFYALSEWCFVGWFVWVPGEQRKAKNAHQCEWLVFTRGACLHVFLHRSGEGHDFSNFQDTAAELQARVLVLLPCQRPCISYSTMSTKDLVGHSPQLDTTTWIFQTIWVLCSLLDSRILNCCRLQADWHYNATNAQVWKQPWFVFKICFSLAHTPVLSFAFLEQNR